MITTDEKKNNNNFNFDKFFFDIHFAETNGNEKYKKIIMLKMM